MKKLMICVIILSVAGTAGAVITFDEFPIGTQISTQYACQGVTFLPGTVTPGLPIIDWNGAMPTQPILRPQGEAAGLYIYQGDFYMTFCVPAIDVQFDSGYWDSVGTAQVNVFGPGDILLASYTNAGTGVQTFGISGIGAISYIYFNSVGDPAGGDIDNLTFGTPEPTSLLLIGIGFGALGLASFRRRRK